jgi:putative pyruvate formate lyase activating enzyme
MNRPQVPAYLALFATGALADRSAEARRHLGACDLCAHDCRVDRLHSIAGAVCRTGSRATLSAWGPHHGEEGPISGRRGSGTIFFSGCNLRCVYCQNWEISQAGQGSEASAEELAATMLSLQRQGCHNINLVSPSHVVAQILEALVMACGKGLRLPLVYNTGGYDSMAALALLDGVIDIYMPDLKYGDSRVARRYSKVRDYVAVNQAAIREMHRQVGDLVVDAEGVARRGLLVRHLVLPEGLAGTEAVLRFVADEISRATYVNIMAQYRPCYRAAEFAGIDRRPTAAEFAEALRRAADLGLHRLDERIPLSWTVGWQGSGTGCR